jgi:uncharacterized membrane protein (DUF2068 family)
MATAVHSAPAPRFGLLRTIALYKLVKVVILLLAAYGEIRLHDATLSAKILSWASQRPQGLEHDLVTRGLVWLSGLSESGVHKLRLLTFTYAAVFAIEGVGLWMQKRWAEWLTVVITASLIPFEVWELIHQPSIGACLLIVGNMLIVGYLYWHVSARHRSKSALG